MEAMKVKVYCLSRLKCATTYSYSTVAVKMAILLLGEYIEGKRAVLLSGFFLAPSRNALEKQTR